jgi:hypothetical protein
MARFMQRIDEVRDLARDRRTPEGIRSIMNALAPAARKKLRGLVASRKRALLRVFAIAMVGLTLPGLVSIHAATYSTGFSFSENPVCEAGRWTNGSADGLDWSDVQSTPGRAFGTLSGAGYDDPTAILTGSWGPDQTVGATVFCANPTSAYHQEVELRLRSTLEPGQSTGYEVIFRCIRSDVSYAQIVRWNGPLGDFTSLASSSGAQYGLATGDVVTATIAGSVIRGYINGVEVVSATDDTFAGGNPGMGFNYGVGDTYSDFGFTRWSANDSTGASAWTSTSLLSGCSAPPVETTVGFADHESLTWDPVAGATQYNVYRGDVASLTDTNNDRLPDSGYGACQDSNDPDTTDTSYWDPEVPKMSRFGFFYLVAYVSGGVEMGLGVNSFGSSRTETLACP